MDVKSYCDSLTIELTGWKAKVYDIVRRLDKLPSGDKEKVIPQVNDLHTLIEELDDRIGRLKNQCRRLWVNSLVTWDGTVVPCCFDKDAEHPFGSLEKEPFDRIWKNRRYSRFRLKVLQNRARVPICTNCTEGIRIFG